ncbi:response regulator transcription factor [Fulvivirgaceae bacterium PWU4]|uniref:Response regulator transcription factor n=1 Tax=Chryseosolibacter histidini TaxID=2782349 RepID=A0AAP2GM90_9BACT|nr:response regulator transcription factor [Chryseosolibacter histidini]MBT1696683.1 response regulator transcription factor [Chryseosolibacter histidini]
MKVKIGIADDQQLFVKSLGELIDRFRNFETVVDALNGEHLLERLNSAQHQPDIILLDVNMPVMDGIGAARLIAERYPSIKIVALSMKDDDTTVINMLKAGCCAYLLKDIHPNELEKALEEVHQKGFYNADVANIRYRRLLLHGHSAEHVKLSDRELTFLKLACSDRTYKQIAAEMSLAERTIDGYREALFEKFNVQSRVGMAMEAIRRKIVTV